MSYSITIYGIVTGDLREPTYLTYCVRDDDPTAVPGVQWSRDHDEAAGMVIGVACERLAYLRSKGIAAAIVLLSES